MHLHLYDEREPPRLPKLCAANMQSSVETAWAPRFTIFVFLLHLGVGLCSPSLLPTILHLCHGATHHMLRNFTARGAKLATFAAGTRGAHLCEKKCCTRFFLSLFLFFLSLPTITAFPSCVPVVPNPPPALMAWCRNGLDLGCKSSEESAHVHLNRWN